MPHYQASGLKKTSAHPRQAASNTTRENETARDDGISLKSINLLRFHRQQLSFSNDTNENSSAIIQAMFQHAFQANHLQNGE
ncbi:CLUMA_CG003108, isoform A [Clunio marinus]|uniref:CLUMA_CG003108, isoform A n=1 Tax=Clunio marinus TaxID=568069 RepID=A0A1J1HS94_9DIPT|nr:CLUMA_CG003108, isoform A [Clunio marinus]